MNRLKILLGITDDGQDALLSELLDEAEQWILNYTYRPDMPEKLRGVQVRLAAMMYNRRGIEGMGAASEGGVSRTIDAVPEDIRRVLNRYRIAQTISAACQP
jgi:hypothetical protein